MVEAQLAHPKIASRSEWLAARKELLAQEKAHTHAGDAVAANLRRLPMVKIEKDYIFDAPGGKVGLLDLFEGRRQLIVYHFMFDPDWENGCMGCTGLVNALGDLSMLNERDVSFALISRAPLAKLAAYKKKMDWEWVWVSSYGTDFNYDFHVTLDEGVAPMQYNYRNKEELAAAGHGDMTGEHHGMSVFFRDGADIFHTYSSYGRGCENRTNSYALLDITPYGRQEDWEDSPAGYPQRPTYG